MLLIFFLCGKICSEVLIMNFYFWIILIRFTETMLNFLGHSWFLVESVNKYLTFSDDDVLIPFYIFLDSS